MKKVLGILRGFPGLGRVVSGVSLLEALRDDVGCKIHILSYLQGEEYLRSRGYPRVQDVTPMDYCSIGLLPTNQMAVHIHNTVKLFQPDLVLIDGEPLVLQSLRISYPKLKIVALLNPSDVDNPENDTEAMEFLNSLYSLSDFAIIHGLRSVTPMYKYDNYISIETILRNEILSISNNASKNIYCVLGGGTVNVGHQFLESTLKIGTLCMEVASFLRDYTINIVCSSQNVYTELSKRCSCRNVVLYESILAPYQIYSNASLVVTRSGRNTLSELAYLGIPTISFISGCKYRLHEQEDNVRCLKSDIIAAASLSYSVDEFYSLCRKMLEKQNGNGSFCCGNDAAIKVIVDILHE